MIGQQGFAIPIFVEKVIYKTSRNNNIDFFCIGVFGFDQSLFYIKNNTIMMITAIVKWTDYINDKSKNEKKFKPTNVELMLNT